MKDIIEWVEKELREHVGKEPPAGYEFSYKWVERMSFIRRNLSEALYYDARRELVEQAIAEE